METLWRKIILIDKSTACLVLKGRLSIEKNINNFLNNVRRQKIKKILKEKNEYKIL